MGGFHANGASVSGLVQIASPGTLSVDVHMFMHVVWDNLLLFNPLVYLCAQKTTLTCKNKSAVL